MRKSHWIPRILKNLLFLGNSRIQSGSCYSYTRVKWTKVTASDRKDTFQTEKHAFLTVTVPSGILIYSGKMIKSDRKVYKVPEMTTFPSLSDTFCPNSC